ncbi:hypothetical protein TVAG_460570 [Trichomonas vaginalis G3]|uniref:Transmembrane protein n=1 Tax=Trichomonas vaginalis (strain ATCC PRA-98 / G3) TaxID=412133 RepID=A2DY31_TRIV3|nr:hypothetical protein TVAG_460570 [Trichomonas vaginalis G3]|eukprot:XP_001326863.1 hypothetical protein [Trichomonas vaginalis G3]
MCFNKWWSLAFTAFACGVSGWVWSGKGFWKKIQRWQRNRIAWFFVYFASMEILQFFQYLVINNCTSKLNIFLTILGFVHICFQPLVTNIAFSAIDPKNLDKQREETWMFIIKFCGVTGFFLAFRILPPLFSDNFDKFFLFDKCGDKEGVCAPQTCTVMGTYHLAWGWKLLKPSYTFPNVAIHFFTMFFPALLLGLYFQSIILFLSGPVLAQIWAKKTSDGERAAIWCFFSIAESTVTGVTSYLACRKQLQQRELMPLEDNP